MMYIYAKAKGFFKDVAINGKTGCLPRTCFGVSPVRILLFSFLSIFFAFSVLFTFGTATANNIAPRLFEGVKKETLPNGLTIITQVNPSSSLVSINFFIGTGSINEDRNTSGISHFCEHMFYRGTGQRSGVQMKAEIENLGGVFNAETSRDFTRYYVNVPSNYGLDVLKIYCDALRNANYGSEQIEQERKVILEEYGLTRENPTTQMRDKIYSQAFGSHPYGRPIIGTENTIRNFTRNDLLNYRSRWYSPQDTSIVIIGNFSREKYLAFLRGYFRDIPGSAREVSPDNTTEITKGGKEIVEEKPGISDVAYFIMCYPSPGIKDRNDVLAMDLLIFMLGQGKGSIFNRELNRDKKLVDEIGADFLTSKDPGLIQFFTQVEPDKIEPLKESIFTILHKMKKGNFSDEDLERARNLLIRTFVYGAETSDGKADTLGFYECLTGMDFAVSYIDSIQKVKKDDVVRVANKYFGDDYYLYVMKPQKRSQK
jgi:zinc protease